MSKGQRVESSNAHAASETLGTPLEKSASEDVRPDFGCHEWSLTQDRFNRPAGTELFPHNPRHFVPGYYRAVPPGQSTLDHATAVALLKLAFMA
jgi:hypothetical protein